MEYKRILSIQDVSCFGQCSLTVALPVLSALGVETAILPTAILSTHTAGFSGFTFRDLKEDLPLIEAHWKKEGIRFGGVYTGYLGHPVDVDVALSIASGELNEGPLFVDPAFGDNGRLYPGFDEDYVQAMKPLCAKADVLLPNLTEAYALLGLPYVAKPDEKQIEELLHGLSALGAKCIVLKGIGGSPEETGVRVYDGKVQQSFVHPRIGQDFHGTGDLFASVFVGAYLHGKGLLGSAKVAATFTYRCIENTLGDQAHAYGVKFEPLLRDLPSLLGE